MVAGPFATLVADCPWRFGDKLPGPKRGAEKHYRTMSVEELRAFPLPPLLPDCKLYFWRVASMQDEALAVIRAWGFSPVKSEIIWIKTTVNGKLHFGMGRHVRMCHEVCLIAVRGRPLTLDRSERSIIIAPVGRHSEKPELFYDKVERLSPGPYVELFARRQRNGWTCLGDEVPATLPG